MTCSTRLAERAILILILILGLSFSVAASSIKAQGLSLSFSYPSKPKDEQVDDYMQTLKSSVLLERNLLKTTLQQPELELSDAQKEEIDRICDELKQNYKSLAIECRTEKEKVEPDDRQEINKDYQAKWLKLIEETKSKIQNEVLVPKQAEFLEMQIRQRFYKRLDQVNVHAYWKLIKKNFSLTSEEHDQLTNASNAARKKMAEFKKKIEEEAAKKIHEANEKAAKKFIDELPKSTKDKIHEELGDDIQLYIDLFIE